ncbi:HAD family hydrolase [Mycoplasma iguanae]|uniref:HAD family hydrolase n=1 Tax=Mycoplasma iguanae TaxID=292461 RepID=A0ABY5RB96_9MOLU|nr:HAD family hydrolase [Mycoplasma iguanae]UVD81885.1 HAD family hydrolase [Mycoplasma iguanae]
MDKKDNVQTLVFDLDGTLLNSEKNVLDSSIETIKHLQKKNGTKAIIASGRPWYFCKKPWNLIDSQMPIISCNGALVFDPVNNKEIFVNPIEKTVAKSIFNYLHALKINFLVYTSKQMFKNEAISPSQWFIWLDGELAKMAEDEKFQINPVNSDFDLDQHQVVKFLVIAKETDPKNLDLIQKEFKKYQEKVYLIKSQPTVLDIMPTGSDKGQGLKQIAQHGLINLDTTLVFGDEVNDIPMFKVAKYSVAMGQSKSEVKTIAKYVTDSHDKDGIANFLKKII